MGQRRTGESEVETGGHLRGDAQCPTAFVVLVSSVRLLPQKVNGCFQYQKYSLRTR